MNNSIIENLEYCNKAIELRDSVEIGFLALGEYLYNIKEHNLFEPQWSSFLEFCFELRMSQNTINKLIQIYKTFVLSYGFTNKEIAPAGVSLLSDILPVSKTKDEANEWLHKAKILTRQDLRKELIEFKTGIDMADCPHDDTYTVVICRHCGDKIQELK